MMKGKLRICYSAPEHIHTQRWITFFARRGHEVHLIVDTDVKYEGVIMHNLNMLTWKSPISFIKKVYLLRKKLQEIKPDILHTHYGTAEGYTSALAGFHLHVLTEWGSDIYLRPHTSKLEYCFTKLTLKQADLITGDSQDIMDEAVKIGAPKHKTRVVQWGVEMDRFNPYIDPVYRKETRDELKVGDCPLIINFRTWQPRLCLHIFIDAIPKVLREVKDAKFLILGYGPEEDNLKRQARELGVWDAVRFEGRKEYFDLARYITASDISVSIPNSDATAMTLLMSMACGLPMVVSDLPSAREWIQDGENGYIVPVEDSDVLAQRIIELIRNPEQRQIFGHRNYLMIKEKANHEEHMQRMEEMYYELVERGQVTIP